MLPYRGLLDSVTIVLMMWFIQSSFGSSSACHQLIWPKKNYYNYIEINNLLTDGLVGWCRSYRGLKIRGFHDQLKTPSCEFKSTEHRWTLDEPNQILSIQHMATCFSDAGWMRKHHEKFKKFHQNNISPSAGGVLINFFCFIKFISKQRTSLKALVKINHEVFNFLPRKPLSLKNYN